MDILILKCIPYSYEIKFNETSCFMWHLYSQQTIRGTVLGQEAFVAFLSDAGESSPGTRCSCLLDLLNRCPVPGIARGREDEGG